MNPRNPAPKTPAMTRAARNTLLAAVFIVAISLITLVLSVFEDFAVGKNAFTLNNALLIIPLGMALASLILSRYRHEWASILMSVSIIISTLGTTFIVSGLGVLLGVLTAFAVVALSTLTLSDRRLNRMVIFGLLVSLVIVFADQFLPIQRPGPGFAIARALPIITAGVFVGFAALIARQFRNYSIRSKLIVASVGLLFLSTGVSAFITDQTIRGSLTEETGTQLHTIALSQGASIGNALAQQIKVLSAFSLSRDVENRLQIANAQSIYSSEDPAEVQAAIENLDQQWQTAVAAGSDAASNSALVWAKLNDRSIVEVGQFQATFPQLLGILYTDNHGGIVATTYLSPDYYQGDEEWWQSAYNNGQGGFYIGQPEYVDAVNAQTITMAIYIRERTRVQRAIVGVLASEVALDSLRASLVESASEQGTHIDLLFPNGQTLGASGDLETTLDAAAVAEIISNTDTFATGELGGEPALFSTAPVTSDDPFVGTLIKQLGWVVLVHQSQQAAFATVDNVARINVLVSTGALLVSALLAYLLAQYLSRPISQLTEAAQKVQAGDLTAQARVNSQDEIGALAVTFNDMTAKLRGTLTGLEQRVAERTRALAITAEVSRRLSTILDQDQLVTAVVEQLRDSFNFYHVHIYLFDENREYLLMAGGTGEAGRIMLNRGHKILKGRGLVGRAAESNLSLLVPDVSQDAQWLPNPLLPETKAEVAVPISAGDQVLGVLDIQQNIVGGLTQADAEHLQAIANQIAVALQNARSFAEAQRQAEREAQLNAINQKILSATTVETALQIAAREVGRAAGAPRVSIRLKAGNNNGGERKN